MVPHDDGDSDRERERKGQPIENGESNDGKSYHSIQLENEEDQEIIRPRKKKSISD